MYLATRHVDVPKKNIQYLKFFCPGTSTRRPLRQNKTLYNLHAVVLAKKRVISPQCILVDTHSLDRKPKDFEIHTPIIYSRGSFHT